MQQYKHTQFGTVIVVAMFLGIVVEIALACVLFNSEPPEKFAVGVLLGVAALCLLCLALFFRLTVEVADGRLAFRFGLELISKSIPLEQISSCKPVKTRMWHGWGIHYYGKGWLYNVTGFGAVEIKLESGKQLRIGTDEPEYLCRAIDEAVKAIRP